MLIRKYQSGFTLIELMVAMGVAGIALGIALPQLGDFNANNKIKSSTNEFQSLIQLARTEAITRGTFVNLSSTNEDNWSGVITLCEASNSTMPCTDGNAELIKTRNIGNDEVVIKSNAFGDPIISFNSRGRLSGATSTNKVILGFCDDRGTDAGDRAKILTINVTGRPRTQGLDITAVAEKLHQCDPT